MTYFSDTLKRHQKLHIADSQRRTRPITKPTKLNHVGTTSYEMTPSDRCTESSVDHYAVQELAGPQFYCLEGCEFPSLEFALMDTPTPYIRIDHVENYFGDNVVSFDYDCSTRSDLTLSPEFLLESI